MTMQWLPLIFLCVVSYLTTSLLVPLAHKINLLDVPDQRKDHAGRIPLIGGIAIYISVVLSSAIFFDLTIQLMGLLAISGVVTLVGLLDDKFRLPAKFRLWVQLLAGIALATGAKLYLTSFGNLFGMGLIELGFIGIPITAIAVAGITNAYNMTDGIDGLAASLSLVAILGLLAVVHTTASEAEVHILLFYGLSLCVFLVFNLQLFTRSREKIFLGDAGSMFMGFSIAGFMIYFSQGENAAIKPVTALWLVAIPLFDIVSAMIRRILKGKSPLVADKTHFHHILIKSGLTRRQALIALIIYSTVCAAIGITLNKMPESISLTLFIILFSTHLYAFRHAYRASKRIKRIVVVAKGLARKLAFWVSLKVS